MSLNFRNITEPDKDPFARRLKFITVLVGVVFSALLLKLFFLQVIKGPYYRELARKRSLRVVSLPAPRGNIYDRRGLLLAGNTPSFALYVDPRVLKGQRGDLVLRRLAKILGEEFPSLKQRYLVARRKGAGNQVLLVEDLDRDMVAKIEARRYFLPGVVIQVEPQRFYPLGEAAFHLVGYVSRVNAKELKRLSSRGFGPDDFLGRSGLEAQFEEVLRGRKGRRLVEVDALGRIRRVVTEEPPQIGKSILLTVDSVFEKEAYRLLSPRSGALVLLDPRDGRLLSLVSAPGLDPHRFLKGFSYEEWKQITRDVKNPLLNKAILPYHPGSTFKLVTAMAALEKGLISPTKEVNCPGYYRLGRRLFRCWKPWGHGKVDLIKAIEVSCDTYFYYLGELVGIDTLSRFARACGFGRKTGLGFPGEKAGLVPDREWKLKVFKVPWQKGETLNVAIGQGALTVTPLQLARFLGAVVNGGHLFVPWYVYQVLDPYGEILEEFGPRKEGNLPASRRTLRLLEKGLVAAVNGEEGTGRAARLKKVLVGGKTGTAQVVGMKKRIKSEKLPYLKRDHAWFIAYAPAQKPEIVIVVFVEHGGHGGSAAAPLAGKFLKMYFEGKWPRI